MIVFVFPFFVVVVLPMWRHISQSSYTVRRTESTFFYPTTTVFAGGRTPDFLLRHVMCYESEYLKGSLII